MSTISRYAVHDVNDEPVGTCIHDVFSDARDEAMEHGGQWVIIEYEYEYSDSSMVENSEGSLTWPPTDDVEDETDGS